MKIIKKSLKNPFLDWEIVRYEKLNLLIRTKYIKLSECKIKLNTLVKL